jgi:hypothetical protein
VTPDSADRPGVPKTDGKELHDLLEDLERIGRRYEAVPDAIHTRYRRHHPPYVAHAASVVSRALRQAREAGTVLRVVLELW